MRIINSAFRSILTSLIFGAIILAFLMAWTNLGLAVLAVALSFWRFNERQLVSLVLGTLVIEAAVGADLGILSTGLLIVALTLVGIERFFVLPKIESENFNSIINLASTGIFATILALFLLFWSTVIESFIYSTSHFKTQLNLIFNFNLGLNLLIWCLSLTGLSYFLNRKFYGLV